MDEKDNNQIGNKEIDEKMAKIRYKLVVMSGKGGVGKSTVATNLAMALALNGFTVGIIDADITGPNIPKMMGIPKDQLPSIDAPNKRIIPVMGPLNIKVMSMAFLLQDQDTPIVWRGPLKMGAINQFLNDVEWGNLDFLVIDLPPGTSDEIISILQLVKDAKSIVVTTPQDVALLDSRKSIIMGIKMTGGILGVRLLRRHHGHILRDQRFLPLWRRPGVSLRTAVCRRRLPLRFRVLRWLLLGQRLPARY